MEAGGIWTALIQTELIQRQNREQAVIGWGRGFKSHPVHFYLRWKYGIILSSILTNCRTNPAAMHIEDTQRLVTGEIEMLKVVLYLVRRERAGREEAS
jgi:hypothetical protein